MSDTYKHMMEEVSLSPQAKQRFLGKLVTAKPNTAKRVFRAAALAACLCLTIVTAVFAMDTLFDLGLLEIVKRPLAGTQEPGIGYNVDFYAPTPRPVTDFAEKWQNLDGSVSLEYDSWDAAKADLGLKLADNTVLLEAYSPLESLYYDSDSPVHCYGHYTGQDGQLYFARVMAAYQDGNTTVFVNGIATADHATVSADRLQTLRHSEVIYPEEDVEAITTEEYTGANGLTATIATIRLVDKAQPNLEAVFMANGISYRVQVYPSRTLEDSKAELIRILDGFLF